MFPEEIVLTIAEKGIHVLTTQLEMRPGLQAHWPEVADRMVFGTHGQCLRSSRRWGQGA